jgi:hypothetical protein
LSREDEEIFFRAKAELASGDILRQLGMVRQLGRLLFRDYPAEVFLQRPECFRMLLSLLKATKSQAAAPNPPEDSVMQLFDAIVDALDTLMTGLRASLKMQLDCEMKHSAHHCSVPGTTNSVRTGINENSYSTNSATTALDVYPSIHSGSVVRAASAKSVTPTVSLGDAALMVAAGALPNGTSPKPWHDKLMPLLRSALGLISEPFPVYHALLSGQVFDHQSLTASRFGRLLHEVDAVAWSTSSSPEHFSGVLEAIFLQILGDRFMVQDNGRNDELGDGSVPSYTKIQIIAEHGETQSEAQIDMENPHQVRVPGTVSKFVRHVLFENSFSFDLSNSPARSKRRQVLLHVLERTDMSGYSLLKQAELIAESVQSTTAMFRKDAFVPAEANDSAGLSAATTVGTGSVEDHDFLGFLTASLTREKGTVVHARESVESRILSLETSVVALLSGDEGMPPAMVSETCGQIIAVCVIASRFFTASADSRLRERCFRLLARLLAFPIPQVQQTVYENLLGVITTHELNGIGFASIELSRAYIDQHIMAGILLDATIFGIILVHGVASRNLETRACAVGIAHQLESLTINQDLSPRVLQPFTPLVDALPAIETGRFRTHPHSAIFNKRLDTRAHVLLGLQRLGSKDPAVRIEAARYLRAQADIDGVGPSMSSPALVAAKMREMEIEADPRMLRDPLAYTSKDASSLILTRPSGAKDLQTVNLAFAGVSSLQTFAESGVSHSKQDVHRLGSLLKHAPRSDTVSAFGAAVMPNTNAENRGVDASIWSAAAVHLTAMLVQGGTALAKQCGAHGTEKDNILLRIFEAILVSGVLRQGNGWQVRAVALDLCVALVGSCSSCWSACSKLESLLSSVLPCVFHAESAVRLPAIRLALLIAFHPCRIVAFLCSADKMDLDELPMLVGVDNIVSYSQLSDEHSSIAPASVVPILYLPSFVLEACNLEIVSTLVNVVQHSFPEVHIRGDGDAEATIMTLEQRQDVATYLRASSTETGSAPTVRVTALLSSIETSQSHTQFIGATEQLRARCNSEPSLHLALTSTEDTQKSPTLWWSVFQRFLVNSPTCSQDDRALCSVMRLMTSLVRIRRDESGRMVCAMSTGGIVALVMTVRRNLYSIVQSAHITSTSYSKRAADSGRPRPRSTVLAVGTDYYASPSAAAFVDPQSRFASENVRIDLATAVIQLVGELYAARVSSTMSAVAKDAIASIGCETSMLETLAVGYIGNTQMRLDARYSAAKVATAIALPVLETQHTRIRVSDNPMITGMRSLFVSFLDVLHDTTFTNFHGKTIVRSAVTFVASVCACSEGIALMSGVLSEKLPTSFRWCERALDDREIIVSAAGHEISCAMSTLKMVQQLQLHEENNKLPVDVPELLSRELEDEVPSGVESAFKTALQSSKAMLVRAAALDSITNTMEALTELSETKFDRNTCLATASRTADWLCEQLAVASHALVDASAGSPRLLLALARLTSFVLLGMSDEYYASHMLGVKRLATSTQKLWESVLFNGISDITQCWEASIQPLLSHAYVPNAFAVDARSVMPPRDVTAFVNERTTSFAVAVSAASAEQGAYVQYGRTSFSSLTTGLVHELWHECHVPVVHQARSMTMFLVHNIPLPRCHLHTAESEESTRAEDEQAEVARTGLQKTPSGVPLIEHDVSLRAGQAAMETLQSSWRVIDIGHGDNMHPSLMIEMAAQLLTSVMFVDRNQDPEEPLPPWWQPPEVLSLAARGAAHFENTDYDQNADVSARCCFLLWCLLEMPHWCSLEAASSLAAFTCSFSTMSTYGGPSSETQSLISALTSKLMSKYFAMYGDATDLPLSLIDTSPAYLRVLESLLKSYPDARKSACEAGGVYFALTQLSAVHDMLMRIDVNKGLEQLRRNVASSHSLGQVLTTQPDHLFDLQRETHSRCMTSLGVHFRFLESILYSSHAARDQALQLGAGEVFQRTWSLLRTTQYTKTSAKHISGCLLCAFLRMLVGMANGKNDTNGGDTAGGLMSLNRIVFGIPNKGVQMFAVGNRSEIKPFSRTDGAPLSLLAQLAHLVTVRMSNAVPMSTPAVASTSVPHPPAARDDGDLKLVQLSSMIISLLAQQDVQASRVLSRTPLVQNLVSLVDRSIDTLPRALSNGAMSKMRPVQVERKTRTIELLRMRQLTLRRCALNMMLSISLHQSEHACFFFGTYLGKNRDTGMDFMTVSLKLLIESTMMPGAARQRQMQAGVLIHVLRNLALRSENKARFLRHPDLLLQILHILGSGNSGGSKSASPGNSPPLLVASSAACLWALVFNNKRIVPMLKESQAGEMCKRALNMLKGYYAGEHQFDIYEGALVLHVLAVLPKLIAWL